MRRSLLLLGELDRESVFSNEDKAMTCATAVCVPLAIRSLRAMSDASSLAEWRILTYVLGKR